VIAARYGAGTANVTIDGGLPPAMTKGEVYTEGRSVAAAADAKTGGAGESAEPPLTRQSGTEFGRVLPRQRTIDALYSLPVDGWYFWDLFPAFALGGAGPGRSFRADHHCEPQRCRAVCCRDRPNNEQQQSASDGKTLQATHVNAAPSSSELHPVETSLYAQLFARAVVTTCVVNGVRSRNVIAEEDGSAA
jgi:hypothetical protein